MSFHQCSKYLLIVSLYLISLLSNLTLTNHKTPDYSYFGMRKEIMNVSILRISCIQEDLLQLPVYLDHLVFSIEYSSYYFSLCKAIVGTSDMFIRMYSGRYKK